VQVQYTINESHVQTHRSHDWTEEEHSHRASDAFAKSNGGRSRTFAIRAGFEIWLVRLPKEKDGQQSRNSSPGIRNELVKNGPFLILRDCH
jgi:hypothetical protein